MPAVPTHRLVARPAGRWFSRGWRPTPRLECAVWLTLAACAVGLRWWLAVHLSTYVWTRDSGSYLAPAVNWLNGEQWVTSARRGPVYSLFIAGILRFGGTLKTVVDIQATLGVFTTFLTVAFVRRWLGARASLPTMVCAAFYVFYGMPLELEKLVRNETLLVFFATCTFGGWFCALRKGSPAWMGTSGFFMGLLQLLKGIFPIFPLIVLGIAAWTWRRQPWRLVRLAAIYLVLFLLPLVSSKLYSRYSDTTRPPEPEDGEMFLGRTAQWAYFGTDGILPDIKSRIRDQIEAYAERYRKTGKLDNNEIVKRTVVPTLKTIIVDERHGTLVEVNRVSWRLGLEAVSHHPDAYLRQFIHDLWYLNFVSAQKMTPFDPKALRSAARDAKLYTSKAGENTSQSGIFELDKSHVALHEAAKSGGAIQRFGSFLKGLSRARFLSPVFLTTVALPLLVWLKRGRERSFWIGSLTLWAYYLILLSTVGRPLDRYFMPMVPLMFWAITTIAAHAWRRWQVTQTSVPATILA